MVNSVISAFFGGIIAAISNASLLYTGHLIARRFFKEESAAVRWVAFGLISAWLVIVLAIALIFTHFFTKTGVGISSAVIAGLAWFFWGKHSSLREELAAIHAFILPYAQGRSAVLLLVTFFIILFQAIRALMMPPLSWDSLTYHMTLAGLWVQNGGYTRLLATDAWDCYSHFPNNGEVFFSWLMVPFRSDLLVNLGNFPFLILVTLAVYGLARKLNIERETSLLATAWVSFSLPLSSYITTQYVDVQSFAEALCGVLFLIKFSQNGQPRDGIMAFAALGLAAGTKVIFLQLLLLSCVVILAILLWKRVSGKALLTIVIGIFVVTSAATAPWYVRNWIETGSPLYPFSLSIGGIKVFQGSRYMYAVISPLEKKLGNGIYESFLYWLKVLYFGNKISVNFGPKFVPTVIGGIMGLVWGLRSRNRIQWSIIGIICCSEFAQFMSKGMRVARLGWVDGSQRFLMLFFALMAISGIFILAKSKRWKQPTVIILVCFVILDLLTISSNNVFSILPLAKGKHYFLTVTVFSIFTFLYYILRGRTARLSIFLIVIIVILGIILLPFVQLYRDKTRYLRFMDAIDLCDIPRDAVPGWEFIDNPSKPVTIAVTDRREAACNTWFLYPLMGRRLQNRLTYISPAGWDEISSYVPRMDSFHKAEASVWIDRVRNAGVDMVFVIMPAPPELTWKIEDNPSIFKLLQKSEGYRIYEFIR